MLSARRAHRRFATCLCAAEIATTTSTLMLTHSFATQIYERTGNVLLVQAALGHRSIASTLVYARVGHERVRSLVAA